MARIKTRTLRRRAIGWAQEAHTFWLTNAIMPRNASFQWVDYEEGGGCYIWIGTLEGTEPLPFRQWVVELKSNGALICAYHQGEQ